MRLLKAVLRSMSIELALEEHMIFEILRLRSGRGTPGALLRMTEHFARRARSLRERLAECLELLHAPQVSAIRVGMVASVHATHSPIRTPVPAATPSRPHRAVVSVAP